MGRPAKPRRASLLRAAEKGERHRNINIGHLDASSAELANFTYIYDNADRLEAKVENVTGTSYGYDVADQLTQDGNAMFGYDAAGNRTTPATRPATATG